MCIRIRIQHAYQGVQGACPRQAVTSAGVTAERSERRDVGTGLKLVLYNDRTKSWSRVLQQLDGPAKSIELILELLPLNLSSSPGSQPAFHNGWQF